MSTDSTNPEYHPERTEASDKTLTKRPSGADRLAKEADRSFLAAIYFDEPRDGGR